MAQLKTLDNMLYGDYAVIFWLRVIIGVLLALFFLAGLVWSLKKNDIAKASMFTRCICVIIGEILGRIVFFGANVPLREVIPYIM